MQALRFTHFASGGSEVAVADIDSDDDGCASATAFLSVFDFASLFAMSADSALCPGAGAHWYSGYDVHRCSYSSSRLYCSSEQARSAVRLSQHEESLGFRQAVLCRQRSDGQYE